MKKTVHYLRLDVHQETMAVASRLIFGMIPWTNQRVGDEPITAAVMPGENVAKLENHFEPVFPRLHNGRNDVR